MSVSPLVCALLVAAVACGGSNSVAPPGASLDGTWTLRSLDHSTLPYRLPQSPNGFPTTVFGATLTFSGDTAGSYTDVIAARVVTPTRTMDTTLTYSGTWVLSGNSITFEDKIFGGEYQGSLFGSVIMKPVLFGYSGEYSR